MESSFPELEFGMELQLEFTVRLRSSALGDALLGWGELFLDSKEEKFEGSGLLWEVGAALPLDEEDWRDESLGNDIGVDDLFSSFEGFLVSLQVNLHFLSALAADFYVTLQMKYPLNLSSLLSTLLLLLDSLAA
eukprot:CAMPEP_0184663148 /NCGR_PEP_ID=MMETSP0308-20130426/46787_1 /TAXON_ID=38269 /ORGANISM="Gloeochaete witrockiana, Strain SAG 46.84" /LENGTH=133 /DNA_ID=CAMNT_0027105689 /DNA_START=977 /DNA_END=1379 /DNA_ORIENTATION=+